MMLPAPLVALAALSLPFSSSAGSTILICSADGEKRAPAPADRPPPCAHGWCDLRRMKPGRP